MASCFFLMHTPDLNLWVKLDIHLPSLLSNDTVMAISQMLCGPKPGNYAKIFF